MVCRGVGVCVCVIEIKGTVKVTKREGWFCPGLNVHQGSFMSLFYINTELYSFSGSGNEHTHVHTAASFFLCVLYVFPSELKDPAA